MACIFAHTSLAKGMPARNSLERVRAAVPDVGMGTPCAEEIYSLYAKGVLAGVDANLTFRPDGALTRAEAAAIVSRMGPHGTAYHPVERELFQPSRGAGRPACGERRFRGGGPSAGGGPESLNLLQGRIDPMKHLFIINPCREIRPQP